MVRFWGERDDYAVYAPYEHNLGGGGGGGGGFSIKKLFKSKGDKILCTLEDRLDAYRIEPSAPTPQPAVHFMLFTKFGLTDYGKNIIKNIHFGLRFESKVVDQQINITSVSPTDAKKEVGTINENQMQTSLKAGSIGAGAGAGAGAGVNLEANIANADLHLGGKLSNSKVSERLVKVAYPKEISIVRSSGVGAIAMWDFSQGEMHGWPGQYDLSIGFKIQSTIEQIAEGGGYYLAYPTVRVNGEEITDNGNPIPPIYIYMMKG